MPPRHRYWTIILEGKPTAFRASAQEDLMPTLKQLLARHPDAVMKWFARGRLWESQDEENADTLSKRRPPAAGEPRPPAGERRTRDWRPGGEHKDPRDRFKISRDEKRKRFAENLWRERPADSPKGDGAPDVPPAKDGESPGGPPPGDDRPSGADAPADRPQLWGRPPRAAGSKPPWKRDRPGGGERDRGNRPEWRPSRP
ncbi:MAG: hypothetical protein QOD74_2624, partial [Variibacter sp.]|nr:hypothetical protein [Variibacter sp.]